MKIGMAVLFSIMVFSVLALGRGVAQEGGQLETLKSSCTSCHGMGRTCAKVGKADKAQWLEILERMNRHGAGVEAGAMDGLADYLAVPSDELKGECG